MKKIKTLMGVFKCLIGWHTPFIQISDGVNTKANCKYCQSSIMKDSQGNWFKY